MDDEIIYSWFFNSVECFDSTPSAVIIILDEDLESFSSFRSHQIDLQLMAHIKYQDTCEEEALSNGYCLIFLKRSRFSHASKESTEHIQS